MQGFTEREDQDVTEAKKTGEREPIVLEGAAASTAIGDMHTVYGAAIRLPLTYILDGHSGLGRNGDIELAVKTIAKYWDARVLCREGMLLLDLIDSFTYSIFKCGMIDYSNAVRAAMLGVALQDHLDAGEYDALVGPLYRIVERWDDDHPYARQLWPTWLDAPI